MAFGCKRLFNPWFLDDDDYDDRDSISSTPYATPSNELVVHMPHTIMSATISAGTHTPETPVDPEPLRRPASGHSVDEPYGDPGLFGDLEEDDGQLNYWDYEAERNPPPADDVEMGTMQLLQLDQTNTWMRAAIPYLPRWLAITLLVINVGLPGLGTIMSGFFALCVGKPRMENVTLMVFVNTWVGLAQLVTIPWCLVGWLWSIIWGVFFVLLANDYHNGNLEKMAGGAQLMPSNETLDTVLGGTAMPNVSLDMFGVANHKPYPAANNVFHIT